jgi:adenine deaminase
MRGGLAVVRNEAVMASLPLPVAGLMSDKSADYVAARMAEIHRAARILGVTIEEPFSAMAFLALPVVPISSLRIEGWWM